MKLEWIRVEQSSAAMAGEWFARVEGLPGHRFFGASIELHRRTVLRNAVPLLSLNDAEQWCENEIARIVRPFVLADREATAALFDRRAERLRAHVESVKNNATALGADTLGLLLGEDSFESRLAHHAELMVDALVDEADAAERSAKLIRWRKGAA